MRHFFIILFLIKAMNTFSQESKRIEYLMPDSVKSKIIEIITKNRREFYIIWATQNDTTSVLLCNPDKSFKPLMDLLEASNRFVKIAENKSMPIILNTDLLFSTGFNVLENRGSKYEALTTALLNPSGFLIKFIGKYGKSRMIYSGFFQN